MTPKQRAELAQSKRRERLAELMGIEPEERSDEQQAELDGMADAMAKGETELRNAILLDSQSEIPTAELKDGIDMAPGEDPARVELRSRCSLLTYFRGLGRSLTGAEAELRDELGLDDNHVPLELWQRPETRAAEERAVTGTPATVGINLSLRPMVFAPSIADRLMVEMPMVQSGTYASATISTAATMDAVAKGSDVPQTAATWTVGTSDPHRIGGSVAFAAEDVAKVGASNFEALLEQHLSMVVSDGLDGLIINGDTATEANEIEGLLKRLTDPNATVPAAGAPDFDDWLSAFADGIDGLWATEMAEVAIVCGVDTYKLSAKGFRDITDTGSGASTAADYLREHTAGWWTNKRMPAADNNVQAAILCRKGRSMEPTPMTTAVVPHWGYVAIDDPFTKSLAGQRAYTIYVLVGDLLLVQPDAYAQVNFRTAA